MNAIVKRPQKNQRNLKKPLDKLHKVCYNKSTKGKQKHDSQKARKENVL